MSGCASNNISKDDLMPRYVSPLLYLNYKCGQMSAIYSEFQKAKVNYNRLQRPRSDLFLRYRHENAIRPDEAKLDHLGKSVLLGHEIALNRAASLTDCQL